MNYSLRIARCSVLVALIFLCTSIYSRRDEYYPPRLTIVVVVDALPYASFLKLQNYFQGGFRKLLEKGIVYTHASWPHGILETATGHTALNTGTFAKDHGVISNSWPMGDRCKVDVDFDESPNAAVFSPDGLYDYGLSPHRIMTDGVSDVLMLNTEPHSRTQMYAISLKSRAAICSANKLGKAIWFDAKSGRLTSSKAYYDKLPDWLIKFNEKENIAGLKSVRWDLCYAHCPYMYDFDFVNNYEFSKQGSTIIGKDFVIDHSQKEPYEMFEKMPQSNKYLLDAALACIDANLSCGKCDRMLLVVSLSQFDKIVHVVGTQAKETYDSLLHLDLQLNWFMRNVYKRRVRKHDVLFVLTADHGESPIPELVHEQGYTPARRISIADLSKKIKEAIRKKFNLDVKMCIKDDTVFLPELNSIEKDKRESLLVEIKKELSQTPGIKNVWTNDELDRSVFQPNSIEYFIQQQRFAGRSGQLFIQVYPYCMLSKYEGGTSHEVPCENNMHVPLIIYRKWVTEKKTINAEVEMLQVAPTMAQLLGIQKPSLCRFQILPGIFAPEEIYI